VRLCLVLEHGLSFDSKSGMLPTMKLSQPTSSSWLRLLHELAKQAEASVDEKKLQKRRSSLLQQTMDAARELRQQMKGEKEMQSCVDRLKRNCKELEDEIEDIEGKVKDLYRCLINVRMTLLGILSQA
jgi:citrate synthase